jgi:uncharacterized lipoprotein YbaY
MVAVVRVDSAGKATVVGSRRYADPGPVPIAFALRIDQSLLDPTATYSLQATIVDGKAAWATAAGVPVLSHGAPDHVAVTLAFRPDLLKGAVTGSITATGSQPPVGNYAVAVLIDPASGQSYGINTNPVVTGEPTAFEVPFAITAIDPNAPYVIDAWIADPAGTGWEAAAGVPVITNGNPKADVQVTVDPVAAPVTAPPADTSRDITGLLLLIGIGAVVALAAAVFMKARDGSDPTDPTDPTAPTSPTPTPGP